jgi:hypothetical protein
MLLDRLARHGVKRPSVEFVDGFLSGGDADSASGEPK